MTKAERLAIILSDKSSRIAFLEHSLYYFGKYYFPEIFVSKSPKFHKHWTRALQSGKNTGIKGFRESAKTVWLVIYYIWCICYRKRRFITHYCYDGGASERRLFDLVVYLQTNALLKDDFGELFPSQFVNKKNSAKKKAGISEFITTNDIMVKAMSIGQSPRGLVFMSADGAHRPDLIGLDDIDVLKSVSNGKIITKNYDFVKGEILGGMSDGAQVVLLGNVIKFDGVVPRIENDHKEDPDWILFQQAIYDADGEIAWKDRYCETDEEAIITGKTSIESKRRLQGSTGFAQNMLLIPASDGDTVIKRHFIQYGDVQAVRIVIGVDPAFSEKTLSDNFAIVVVAYDREGRKCVRACYALKEKEKEYKTATDFIERIYRETGANIVQYEAVLAQTVLAKMLRDR